MSLGSLLEAFFLIFALSIDSFVSSLAYGTDKITIPLKSTVVISFICSLALLIPMTIGSLIKTVINNNLISIMCFLILFILGIVKIFDSGIKKIIKKCHHNKKIEFSFFSVKFILNIYAEPCKADRDLSKKLSVKESVTLAVALSFDSLAAGLGMGLVYNNYIFIFVLAFIIGVISIITGQYIGNKLAKTMNIDLSWISGLILIILGITKI